MRLPAVAGHFYPADETTLRRALRDCFLGALGPGSISPPGSEGGMVAALSPHAGIMASGMGAAHVYEAILKDGFPEAYILIGPKHRHRGREVSLCDQPFLTPLGVCSLHEAVLQNLKEGLRVDNNAHSQEHCLEMQVIFLQYIDPMARIVPVLMGDQSLESAEALADAVSRACKGRRVMVIASGDMSHYVSKEKAQRDDSAVIERMLALDVPGMYDTIYSRGVSACGYGPTATAILSARPSSAKLLKQMDSGDVFESREVVGYASVAFYR